MSLSPAISHLSLARTPAGPLAFVPATSFHPHTDASEKKQQNTRVHATTDEKKGTGGRGKAGRRQKAKERRVVRDDTNEVKPKETRTNRDCVVHIFFLFVCRQCTPSAVVASRVSLSFLRILSTASPWRHSRWGRRWRVTERRGE